MYCCRRLLVAVRTSDSTPDQRLTGVRASYNVGFHSGAAAGQTVPHVHVHVIPR